MKCLCRAEYVDSLYESGVKVIEERFEWKFISSVLVTCTCE